MLSVDAAPVQACVIVSDAAEAIELGLKVNEPVQIVCVIVADADGNVIVVVSVPANVRLLLTVNTLPLAIVSVPVDEVTVRPLALVKVIAPNEYA
jgi:hypothetical protein